MNLNTISSKFQQIAIFSANAARSVVQILIWATVLAVALAVSYLAVRGILHVTIRALNALGV